MNINEHPDFQIEKIFQNCPSCCCETEFHSGIRHNADDMPPRFEVCQICGFDYEIDDLEGAI